MRTVVIIPARYKSTRFPGKPLVPLLGKPMIVWVANLSAEAVGREHVYVATDNVRIAQVVSNAGYSVVMTDSALTGTDRVAEAAEQIAADIYIDVQGDEPLVTPIDIRTIRDFKKHNMDVVVNGYRWMTDQEDPQDVNIPKVVTTESGYLVYMSRLPVPGYKDESRAPARYKKQVCIYAHTTEELGKFRQLGRKSYMERCEDIEILRFIDLNIPVLMVQTSASSHAVDVPADVPVVEELLKARGHTVEL